MLVLRRNPGQSFILKVSPNHDPSTPIEVEICAVKSGSCAHVGVTAPDTVDIIRKETLDATNYQYPRRP